MKTCEECGAEFECAMSGGSTPCWCSGFKLSEQHLAFLSEHFGDCLCPDCLRGTQQKSAAIPSVG